MIVVHYDCDRLPIAQSLVRCTASEREAIRSFFLEILFMRSESPVATHAQVKWSADVSRRSNDDDIAEITQPM